MTELLLLLVAAGLTVACGMFVAAEFSLITVDRSTVERAVEDGDRRAGGVLAALRSLSTQLSGAQLGITVTNLAIGFLAEPSIARLIDGPLESLGVPSGAVSGVSVAIALLLATALTMIFGELVPKNLAIARPLATARSVSGFQRGFSRAMALPLRGLNGTAEAILRRVGVEPQEELASARSAEELSSLVRRSAEQGTLEPDTARLLQRSLAFGDRRAVDVMTPRVRVHALQAGQPVEDVLRTARETGHSRFPVEGEGAEDVAGIVHVKQAFGVPHARRGVVTVGEVMSDPVVVPDTLELDPLLAQLRAGGLQIAVVVDEFGAVAGVVTLEDLIEEIVGEVNDEHDAPEPADRRDADGAWILSALLRPDEASERIGVELPEGEDYETLGGLVALHLERVPDADDEVRLILPDEEHPRHAVTLTVVSMDSHRVDELRVAVEPLDEGADGEDGSADRRRHDHRDEPGHRDDADRPTDGQARR
ncbi:MAG: hemolysin family protein [Solirubrobacteraceae bacterium]